MARQEATLAHVHDSIGAGIVSGLDGGDEQLEGCPLRVLVHVAAQFAAENVPRVDEVLQPSLSAAPCSMQQVKRAVRESARWRKWGGAL